MTGLRLTVFTSTFRRGGTSTRHHHGSLRCTATRSRSTRCRWLRSICRRRDIARSCTAGSRSTRCTSARSPARHRPAPRRRCRGSNTSSPRSSSPGGTRSAIGAWCRHLAPGTSRWCTRRCNSPFPTPGQSDTSAGQRRPQRNRRPTSSSPRAVDCRAARRSPFRCQLHTSPALRRRGTHRSKGLRFGRSGSDSRRRMLLRDSIGRRRSSRMWGARHSEGRRTASLGCRSSTCSRWCRNSPAYFQGGRCPVRHNTPSSCSCHKRSRSAHRCTCSPARTCDTRRRRGHSSTRCRR